MASLKMALHCSHRVTDKPKGHMFIRRRLVLNENMDISITGGCFQTVEHVTEILPEIIFNERARFQLQRAEIADRKQLCRQVYIHEIACGIRLCQKLPERRIMRCRIIVFSSSTQTLKNINVMVQGPTVL